jgi:hypothetical protein
MPVIVSLSVGRQYEEVVLGSPLPLWERDRVRGKGATTDLLIQTKNAVDVRD